MTPQVALRLIEDRHTVVIEPGLGDRAGFSDSAYTEVGVDVKPNPYEGSDLVVVVGPPTPEQASLVPEGGALAGFLDPFNSADLIKTLTERHVTAFAMEAIPRTTLAQSMDALSSQATAAGYHAVLLAATATPRIFPMLTTAAGTIPPVKGLVLGAGVAGLQAIATAKRLGAIVSAYDIRPEVQEQIESLGAKFIAAPVDESAAAATGYAKEVADETARYIEYPRRSDVQDRHERAIGENRKDEFVYVIFVDEVIHHVLFAVELPFWHPEVPHVEPEISRPHRRNLRV